MTSIETHCTSPSADEPPPPATDRRKSVLYCPACGFASAVGENWIVRSEGEASVYVCPDCSSTVATR